jgi:hypothetical protein
MMLEPRGPVPRLNSIHYRAGQARLSAWAWSSDAERTLVSQMAEVHSKPCESGPLCVYQIVIKHSR